MQKVVEYPKYLFNGIKANHRGIPEEKNMRIFGGDNETYMGEPHTVQLFDGTDLLFEYVTPETVFKTWATYLFDHSRERGVNVCYVHYLRFDCPIIFFEKRLAIYEQVSEVKFQYKGYDCDILFGKINKITLSRCGRKVHIFDSWSFTQASLARSLQMFKLDAKKLDKSPALLASIGRTRYNDLPENHVLRVEFEKYAKTDATSEYALGRKIMDFHREYEVRPCISLPQFSARVFRHHFFKPEEVIQFPSKGVLESAELSYHGGKNGFYLDKPSVVEDAYEVDISSAYPYAMTKIPQMIEGSHIHVNSYDPKLVGIYRVSGYDMGKYPLIYDHDFKPVRGKFSDLWVTSYEVARALKSSDVSLEVSEGWLWVPDPSYTHNPLAEYVRHFYRLKEQTAKTDPNYYFYKIMLNGLYGKFVQTTDVRRLEVIDDSEAKSDKLTRERIVADYTWDSVLGKLVKSERTFRAGGLYNPFIATLITGFVRGYLYDLETKYQAFHSATDAVKTTIKPKKIDGLGGLKIETFGRCYSLRNKLYLHFARSNNYCGHDLSKIKVFDHDGQHLCKFGLHGFKGTSEDLFKAKDALLRGDGFEYSYNHMIGLREGFKRREPICSMTRRTEVLRLQ